MFGKLFLLMSLVFLQACAQPRYENVIQNPNEGMGSGPQEKASACQLKFNNSGYCISWSWEKTPTESDKGSLIFKIYRGNLYDDTLVMIDPVSTPKVILWMPSMGHGSSPTKVERLDVGTFRANEVFFVMPGDWEIRFQIKEGANITDEAIVSLSI